MVPENRSAEAIKICNMSSIVPVLTIDDIEAAVPLARALLEGGLKVIEVTLRTSCAWEAVEEITNSLPDLNVGIGTVLSPDQIKKAISKNAKFIVTPGTTETLINTAKDCDAPIIPGVATASEAMRFAEHGYVFQKLFPANAIGGVSLLRSLQGPLPHITFFPTGGVSEKNSAEFLNQKNVVCVGGSWMIHKELIVAKDWDGIQYHTRNALATIQNVS